LHLQFVTKKLWSENEPTKVLGIGKNSGSDGGEATGETQTIFITDRERGGARCSDEINAALSKRGKALTRLAKGKRKTAGGRALIVKRQGVNLLLRHKKKSARAGRCRKGATRAGRCCWRPKRKGDAEGSS